MLNSPSIPYLQAFVVNMQGTLRIVVKSLELDLIENKGESMEPCTPTKTTTIYMTVVISLQQGKTCGLC